MQHKLFNTELINNYLDENKLSKTDFCKQCRISIITLNKILTNNNNIGMISLFKVARTLDVVICDLFAQ